MQTCRILIVEDESIVALNLQQRLTKLGYEVPAIASSSSQALEKIKKVEPDLVLMDIYIEGNMDGIETARNIPKELNTVVIFLTAFSEDSVIERAKKAKPYGFLIKPFSERELHATIQMAMERLRLDRSLIESEERLRLAMDAAQMCSWELDLAPSRSMRVERADRLFGFEKNSFTGSWDDFCQIICPTNHDELSTSLDRTIATNDPLQLEVCRTDENGTPRWLNLQAKIFAPYIGSASSRLVGVAQDVTERKNSEQRLLQAATVFETSLDGIAVLDRNFRTVRANKSFCELLRVDYANILGLKPDLFNDNATQIPRANEIEAALESEGRWSGNFIFRRNESEDLHCLVKIAAVCDSKDKITHYIAVFSDLTAIRAAEEKLFHLAHHDPLTGLPNRLLGRERLDQKLLRAKRTNSTVSVLFVDLDFFKRVNDTLGHKVGDDLLRDVSIRLQECVRDDDTVTRLGGDEFMVVLDSLDATDGAITVANKIIRSLARPFTLDSYTLAVSTSIGISRYPTDCLDADDLITAADSAMYVAKKQGRNRYALYTSKMLSENSHYMAHDQDLRRAFRENEFVLYYQPQHSLQTGAIIGAEALIRWNHPVKGVLGAEVIIPVAEDNGMIVELGEWILREACQQTKKWSNSGMAELRISVNVSARQMRDDRLVAIVKDLLNEFSINDGQLEIEITESTLQGGSAFMSTLHQLKDIGVSLAIDDFGTGYSCLSSLRSLPINRLKIDRSFISDMHTNEHSHGNVAITDAIISMAHHLNLLVIAEGVETSAQENTLRSRFCDEVQGYLYAKPLTSQLLTKYFNTSKNCSLV